MKNLFDKHIELVEAVNSATTQEAHYHAQLRLGGFRDALEIIGVLQLCECDNYYLDKGIDRPMCCGVWLDWQPQCGVCEGLGAHPTGDSPVKCGRCDGTGHVPNVKLRG